MNWSLRHCFQGRNGKKTTGHKTAMRKTSKHESEHGRFDLGCELPWPLSYCSAFPTFQDVPGMTVLEYTFSPSE